VLKNPFIHLKSGKMCVNEINLEIITMYLLQFLRWTGNPPCPFYFHRIELAQYGCTSRDAAARDPAHL